LSMSPPIFPNQTTNRYPFVVYVDINVIVSDRIVFYWILYLSLRENRLPLAPGF